ncbi:MAG: hypothetical protein NVSMB19_21340 [Vulcanimicrobiaceae bacterium]
MLALLGASPAAAAPQPAPAPSATPVPNPAAERAFARAREVWRARTDVPYVRYGALVRYLHNGHVFDTWWDANYRSGDGALALARLHDADEENHRLRGVPFSIFGLKIFDTNRDAEPIRLDQPRIDPASSFGVLNRFGTTIVPRAAPSTPPRSPGDGTLPDFTLRPKVSPTPELREISRVEASTREYAIDIGGTETIAGVAALHLTLVPLRDPKVNRLRDLWLDPATFRTLQTRVQGLLNGKPYDGVPWTVKYVVVDGRQYIQQIVADEPLKFGLDTTIPKLEFDFVDYHFPADVPKFTFERPF